MRTHFFVDGIETSIHEYFFAKGKKGYVEKITHDKDSEIRNLEFNEAEYKLNQFRKKRKYLLDEGFDKWEKAMLAGRESNDEDIYQWYDDLKELKESALENIPERIRYYLGGVR